MSEKHGRGQMATVTLTFRRPLINAKRAHKVWHSFLTHVLAKEFPDWIKVFDRHESGGIHYHIVFALSPSDAGADFERVADHLARRARDYGFGRVITELVKSVEAFSQYLSKKLIVRDPRSKRVRLVEYSRSARPGNQHFSKVNGKARLWRKNVEEIGLRLGCSGLTELRQLLGLRFERTYVDFIKGWNSESPKCQRELELLMQSVAAVRARRGLHMP